MFRFRVNRASFVVFAIVGVWVLLLFLTPFLLSPGTVRGLDGRANIVDYPELWSDMPPVVSHVYYFGDLNCHQKEERSIILNGNQMAVCARDVGLFLGMALGSFLMVGIATTDDLFHNSLKALPGPLYRRLVQRLSTTSSKRNAAVLLGLALAAPMVADGFVQLLTGYESTNPMRLFTGALFGIVLAVLVCSVLESVLADNVEGYSEGNVLRPDGT